jgi:hypothetical protein
MGIRTDLRIAHNLDQTRAVTQVNKRDPTMVTLGLNPAHEHHLLTDLGTARFSTQAATLPIA